MAWSEIGTIKGDKGDPGPSTPSVQSGNTIVKGSDNLLYSASEVDDNAAVITDKSTTKAPTGKVVEAALQAKADRTYVDDALKPFVGGISLVGTFNGATGNVSTLSITAGGATTHGLTIGSALPAGSAANKGMYLIVTLEGTTSTTNGPVGHLIPGDWVVSTGSGKWAHMDMSAHEKEIYYGDTDPGASLLIGQIWVKSNGTAVIKTGASTYADITVDHSKVVGLSTNYLKLDNTAQSVASGKVLTFVTPPKLTNKASATDHVVRYDQLQAAITFTAGAPTGATATDEKYLHVNTANNSLQYKQPGSTTWSTATLRGAGWHTGSGAPPASVAGSQVGDLWLDTTSGKVWKLS